MPSNIYHLSHQCCCPDLGTWQKHASKANNKPSVLQKDKENEDERDNCLPNTVLGQSITAYQVSSGFNFNLPELKTNAFTVCFFCHPDALSL